MNPSRLSAGMALVFAALSIASPAESSSLHIAPVSLRLEAGQQAAGITLSNPSDRPLVAQVRVLAWSQEVSDDQLLAQQDVVASPPIVTVAPHAEQLVRVVRLSHAVPARELTYRLLIDELPDLNASSGNGAVDIRLRYSVPLFVLPGVAPADPSLDWQLIQHAGGLFMKVSNSGGLHAQLSSVKLIQADGTRTNVSDGLLGYALAGSSREWPLSVAGLTSTKDVRVTAVVNGTPIEAKATVPPVVANR